MNVDDEQHEPIAPTQQWQQQSQYHVFKVNNGCNGDVAKKTKKEKRKV